MMEGESPRPKPPEFPRKPQIYFRALSERPLSFLELSKEKWFGFQRLTNQNIFVEWFQHFAFEISADGHSIVCYAEEKSSQLSAYLESQVFSFALICQGYDSLHGTLLKKDNEVIALLGESGRGKSTLASYLISRGWILMGDDLIAFYFNSEGQVQVLPGDPYLKIQSRVYKHFFSKSPVDTIMNNFTRKKILKFPRAVEDSLEKSLSLKKIFYLNRPQLKISRELLSKKEAFWVLHENIFNTVEFRQERIRNLFLSLSRFNEEVQVFKLNYPRQFDSLPQVEELIDQVFSFRLSKGPRICP